MYALFDDAGKFHAGRVLQDAGSALHIELDSGRRVKVKSAVVLLRFEQPPPAELLARARAEADAIDLDLAWQFAPEGDFGFGDLAREYFDARAGVDKQAAALLRLAEAPHYFRRVGKGVFRKAPEETVKAALAAIERRKKIAEQIDAWASELIEGRCPDAVREQLYRILFRPDKNAPEYKAVVEAARRSQAAPLALLTRAGAIANPYQFHWRRFLFEQFPAGTGFAPHDVPVLGQTLPLATVQAFSIDDSATTEIDDALSVQGLGSGTVVLGIHIAAPGLAIAPDSALDRVARERQSTVYMPGWKITMLPDDVVAACTLEAGRDCAALSLYVSFDEATLEPRGHETRIERVPVAANLRHDRLDDAVTEAALTGSAPAAFDFAAELAFAFRLAGALKARREQLRGKPESFTRPDYAFRLDRDDGAEPDGSERVSIEPRRRGAPLDLIVSEAMILANSTWGGWLAELGVPGVYRSQASLAPGIKVRMGTKPLPHAGLGVPQYLWATSPLRRAVDLANQWQLIACVRHGRTAALAAPFKPKDAALFALISAFDTCYGAYQAFQQGIERYWTLRWLEQNGVTELDAAVIKPGLVRAETLPLVLPLAGSEALARGTRVRLRVAAIDLLTLELHGTLLARLDERAAALEDEAEAEQEAAEAAAGALHLAIDVAEQAPADERAPQEGADTVGNNAAAV
ncbi:MAG: RNB domain-containing ribonuclease [Burkholderiales bacterium]|nr:RNB domain-containing ribonuclease [Burkholderiales bacterium]